MAKTIKKLPIKKTAKGIDCGLLHIKIAGPKRPHEFTCLIHLAANRDQMQLDPEKFYIKKSVAEQVPRCPHYELELIGLNWPKTENEMVHLHEAEGNRWFVCYTKRIPDLATAENVFKMWATGALYTMLTGKDFGRIFSKLNESYDKFVKYMHDNHNITFREIKREPARKKSAAIA